MNILLTGSLLALSGCPRSTPAPIVEEATRTVEVAADIEGADGVRATVVGTLERRHPEGVSVEGTAVVLRDGTAVYVSESAPPEGWEWMLGTMVRIQGTLWEQAPSGWPVSKLLDAEPPMPADVSILLGAPQ